MARRPAGYILVITEYAMANGSGNQFTTGSIIWLLRYHSKPRRRKLRRWRGDWQPKNGWSKMDWSESRWQEKCYPIFLQICAIISDVAHSIYTCKQILKSSLSVIPSCELSIAFLNPLTVMPTSFLIRACSQGVLIILCFQTIATASLNLTFGSDFLIFSNSEIDYRTGITGLPISTPRTLSDKSRAWTVFVMSLIGSCSYPQW